MNNTLKKHSVLFLVGGIMYMLIEIVWRSHTHWTMGITGGICFILIGLLNEFYTYKMSLINQMLISSIIITVIEFIVGCIVNIWLKWNIWDYSSAPFNVLGQVCLPYMFLWFLLSAVAIIVDDWLRYFWFNEERPRYTIV